jgi:hypothetical protein
LRSVNPLLQIQTEEADSKQLSFHLIELARKSGQLNISGRGLASGTANFNLRISQIAA